MGCVWMDHLFLRAIKLIVFDLQNRNLDDFRARDLETLIPDDRRLKSSFSLRPLRPLQLAYLLLPAPQHVSRAISSSSIVFSSLNFRIMYRRSLTLQPFPR